MQKDELIRRAWLELEPELSEQGYEVVEIEYARQSSRNILRFYIDRKGGITLDNCTAASQLLGALLDKEDFMPDNYALEVSSPGIARPIRKTADFERYMDEKVKIVSLEPVKGRKRFSGVLKSFCDGLASVEVDGEIYDIHIENIKKANLDR